MVYNRYRAARGSPMTDERAEQYGTRLEALQEELGRQITAEDILEDAKPEGSPLHDWFEWDDAEAAEKYRLKQARDMVRYIVIVPADEDGEKEPVRAFVSVQTAENGRGYMGTARAMSDIELRKQVIEEALKALAAWQRKYQYLTELASIFEAIGAGREQLKLEV